MPRRQPGKSVSWTIGERLQCLWYQAALADTLACAEEFLRTPAGIAALEDFCRARRSSPAPRDHARTVIDAVCSTVARMRAQCV